MESEKTCSNCYYHDIEMSYGEQIGCTCDKLGQHAHRDICIEESECPDFEERASSYNPWSEIATLKQSNEQLLNALIDVIQYTNKNGDETMIEKYKQLVGEQLLNKEG